MPKKFFVIGKVPGYNKHINKRYSYEDKLLPHMAFVDLYPRTLKLNRGLDIKNPNDLKTFVNDVLTYEDEEHPMKWFNKVMSSHSQYLTNYNPSAGYDGIRFIATVDSAINNSISHEYDENILDRSATGIKDFILALADSKTGGKTSTVFNAGVKTASAYKMLSGNQYNGDMDLNDFFGTLDALSGYRIHMPKMWTNTNVQDILQLSIKLTSPSGDPESIKRYIIEPLIIIFIMSSPLSRTGTDLSTPFIYEVDAHGIGHYKLAGITNINFDRGGTDVDFNIYQQPLTVNVRLTLQPLAQDALTALKDPSFYKNAWFQTPESVYKSLLPKNEFANTVKNIYKKGY